MSKVEDADLVGNLRTVEKVRVTSNWLEERNYNITEELSSIADLFSDFKFVDEIREKSRKLNLRLFCTPNNNY